MLTSLLRLRRIVAAPARLARRRSPVAPRQRLARRERFPIGSLHVAARRAIGPAGSQGGQASVELVALLPLIAAALAALVQAALVGHAAWALAQAAPAAARASAVDGDPGAAARAALPPHLERGLRVVRHEPGDVELRIHAPSLVPALDLGTLVARGRFEAQA